MAKNVIIVGGEVKGIFEKPQPGLEGFEVVADDDARIATFLAAQAAPAISTVAEVIGLLLQAEVITQEQTDTYLAG